MIKIESDHLKLKRRHIMKTAPTRSKVSRTSLFSIKLCTLEPNQKIKSQIRKNRRPRENIENKQK